MFLSGIFFCCPLQGIKSYAGNVVKGKEIFLGKPRVRNWGGGGRRKIPIRDADVAIHLSSPSPGNCGGIENARENFRPNKICGHETAAGRMISESIFPPQNFFLHTVVSPLLHLYIFSERGCIAATACKNPFLAYLLHHGPMWSGTALWFIRTRGGAVSICMCTQKRRRASVTRIVYACIITIRLKNGRVTRAVEHVELLEPGCQFFSSLSLFRGGGGDKRSVSQTRRKQNEKWG